MISRASTKREKTTPEIDENDGQRGLWMFHTVVYSLEATIDAI